MPYSIRSGLDETQCARLRRVAGQRHEPRARPLPLALHGALRDLQRVGGLVQRVAGVEPALDDADHLRIQRLEAFQQLVDQRNLLRACRAVVREAGQIDIDLHPAALVGKQAAGIVHDHHAHGAGGEREVVPAVDPLQRLRARQLGITLVHQRRSVQRFSRPPALKLIARDAFEVAVDPRQCRIRLGLAAAPRRAEQASDLALIFIVHRTPPNAASITMPKG